MRKPFLLTLYFLCFLAFCDVFAQDEFNGYALFNNQNSNTTYLIDANQNIAKTWTLNRPCNYTVLLKDNGNLMRGATRTGNFLNGPAVGGLVQEIDPQGNIVWEFEYSSPDFVSHHDITLMPDGGVLLIAWEVKTQTEMQAMGFQGTGVRYPTHFIEVQQDGTGGKIVWEWHIFDHLIQDVDPDKPNYGVVADHPERLDINFQSTGNIGIVGDWIHCNGVDYDPIKDQIIFSSRYLSEVFIIDHSTTTEEARGSTGGNAGKGGDFLYRWGRPINYDHSGANLIGGPVHDARIIEAGPREGFLQFFNNDGPNGLGSTVDALELPVAADGYNYIYTEGVGYGPEEATFSHKTLTNATGQSASNSLPNGNVFVALSRRYMYEVNSEGETVWTYDEGPPKGFRYTCDHPGIQALINTGELDGVQCGLVNSTADVLKDAFDIVPNPGNGFFKLNGDLSIIQSINVFDMKGRKLKKITQNFHNINLEKEEAGTYLLSITTKDGNTFSKKLVKF